MILKCKNCGWEFEAEDIPEQCPVCQTGEKDKGDNCPNCGFEKVGENIPPLPIVPDPGAPPQPELNAPVPDPGAPPVDLEQTPDDSNADTDTTDNASDTPGSQ